MAWRRATSFFFVGSLLFGAAACDSNTPAETPSGSETSETDQQTSQPSQEATEPERAGIITLDDDFDASHQITLDVPNGYGSVGGWGFLKSGLDETGVSVWVVDSVFADGCKGDDSPLDRSHDGSIDSLAAILASQEGFRVSTPTDVEVDGFAGTYMERTLSARKDPDRCVSDRFMVWHTLGNGDRWLSYSRQQDLLWVLDVDGAPLMIDAAVDAGASAQDRAEVIRMVESIRIDPR